MPEASGCRGHEHEEGHQEAFGGGEFCINTAVWRGVPFVRGKTLILRSP